MSETADTPIAAPGTRAQCFAASEDAELHDATWQPCTIVGFDTEQEMYDVCLLCRPPGSSTMKRIKRPHVYCGTNDPSWLCGDLLSARMGREVLLMISHLEQRLKDCGQLTPSASLAEQKYCRSLLGVAYQRTGRFAEAKHQQLADLQMVFRLRDHDRLPMVYSLLFSSHLAMGDHAEACQTVELQHKSALALHQLVPAVEDAHMMNIQATRMHSKSMELAFHSSATIECTLHTSGKTKTSTLGFHLERAKEYAVLHDTLYATHRDKWPQSAIAQCRRCWELTSEEGGAFAGERTCVCKYCHSSSRIPEFSVNCSAHMRLLDRDQYGKLDCTPKDREWDGAWRGGRARNYLLFGDIERAQGTASDPCRFSLRTYV
jgi:hypothetical protein